MIIKKKKVDADECRRLLLRAIRDGDYAPGKRLRVALIAAHFKTTPAIVRQVFDELTMVGILERRPRCGTFIRRITIKEFLDSSLVRAWLEALAARLACQHLTETQLQELEVLAEQLDAESLDQPPLPARYVDLEIAFHEKIVVASDNIVLNDLARRHHFIVRYIEQHARLGLTRPESASGHPSHRQLVDLLRQRDPLRVQQAMYRHVLLSAFGLADQVLPGEQDV